MVSWVLELWPFIHVDLCIQIYSVVRNLPKISLWELEEFDKELILLSLCLVLRVEEHLSSLFLPLFLFRELCIESPLRSYRDRLIIFSIPNYLSVLDEFCTLLFLFLFLLLLLFLFGFFNVLLEEIELENALYESHLLLSLFLILQIFPSLFSFSFFFLFLAINLFYVFLQGVYNIHFVAILKGFILPIDLILGYFNNWNGWGNWLVLWRRSANSCCPNTAAIESISHLTFLVVEINPLLP